MYQARQKLSGKGPLFLSLKIDCCAQYMLHCTIKKYYPCDKYSYCIDWPVQCGTLLMIDQRGFLSASDSPSIQ